MHDTLDGVEALRERFGKYHVLEKIAQGGMAEVYKVKTVGIAGFEKIQALKRILPHSAREGRFIRSFIDEARIAVELTHRNIVQVFDFGKADGELFLAMELIEGRDLRTAMADATSREMVCPIPVAAYIIAEAAAGLDYAHRKTDGYGGTLGIVHCDVSPSNVMLSTDGYVKILDFGIARASFASALERRRLRGKPRYMAPEQTLGEPPTAAADVFALGIIAWELFTGLPLFHGTDIKAILEAVRKYDPPRIDRIKPNAPLEIVDAIATALSRDPAARGAAADIVAACTRTALAGGARALAGWLADLDAQETKKPVAWEKEQQTSISMRRSGSVPSKTPPPRESTRSMTGSINARSPHDLGAGTPGFGKDDSATSPTAKAYEAPADRAPTVPSRYSERDLNVHRFGDRDPTASVTAPNRFPGEPTGSNPAADSKWSGPDTTTGAKFGYEATTSGVAKLADDLPPELFSISAPSEPEQRPSRPYYEQIVLAPGAPPSALRFDDEATQHGFAAPSLGEATSFDDLEIEPERGAALEPVVDEPIDDDLGAIAVGGLWERRRSVVVSGVLDGAHEDVLRPIVRSLGELAYQRGGVVLELDETALLVAFGLEVAGEDDVAIAMGWASDAAAMTRDAGPTLRVGARTGVASASGEGNAAQIPADAIEEARALARAATPDRPLFAGAADRITSSLYALQEVPAPDSLIRLGKVIEVVGPRTFDERDRARLERRGKFVGRIIQLTELEVWFQRAIAADRRLSVMVQGAAGTGKSRLVAELIARRRNAGADADAMRVVITAANPASGHAPFALVIDLYQAALGLPPLRGRTARAQFAHRLLHLMHEANVPSDRARTIATDLDRAMELRDGVGVGTPEVADLRPRISAGMAAFRLAMADRKRPQLTVIEDLHLADNASLEVLRHTLAVPAQGPELLILTSRPEGPPWPAVDAKMVVGDLVGGELRALIADRLGDAATPLNIAAVIARGGGNPLFIEELAQAVREAGDDVPATARDVVAARVDRLLPKAKTALQFAAVLGGAVRARLLEELLGEQSLASELDELVESEFLVRPESGAHSSEGELEFARGLVREVIYEGLSPRAQRESHGRVGRLLASRFFAGREEPPSVIADHLERGGEMAGAAAFWLRAGRLAASASDADEAVAHFSRTLILERSLGDVPPTPTSRARRREAYAGREEAHRLQGDLASDAGDLDELQRLCEGEPRRLADVALRRAARLLRLGDYAGATVATVVAEDHATALRDQRLQGEALRVRGEILERLGQFDEALDVVSMARELFAREGATSQEMQAMVGRGRIYLMRAHYVAAHAAYQPVLARIEKTGDPWLERVVANHVAVIEMCLGNFMGAMASAQRSLDLCRRYGDRAREGDALSVSGIILLEVGLYDQAAATFAEALELLGRTASRWSRADCLIYAGVCEIRRGHAGGLAMLDEALGEARRLGARYLEANALISRAGAHLRRDELDAAVSDAAEGTAVAQSATLVGYEIQGLARHAVALVRQPSGGHLAEAGGDVHFALAAIERQRFLEGSEEEVYTNCIEVLRKAGADDRAERVKATGRAEVERKLAGLTDPVWRAAYSAIPEVRALLE